MAFIIIIGLLNYRHYYQYLFIHCGGIAFITLEALHLLIWKHGIYYVFGIILALHVDARISSPYFLCCISVYT
jgi:hypothetical protein